MVVFTRRKNKISFASPKIAERKVIRKTLTIMHPNYYSMPYSRRKYWDGYVRFYDKKNNTFYSGLLPEVLERLKEEGITYSLFRDKSVFTEIPAYKFHSKLLAEKRFYQRQAVDVFLKKRFGIIVIPTRGGKTVVASELIRILNGEKVLMLVDNVDLFHQSIEEIQEHTNEEVGRIREKDFIIKRITVGMIQTISSINAKQKSDKARHNQLVKLYEDVSFLIVDEVQEYAGENRIKILNKFNNLNFFLSISATPFKSNNIISHLNIKGITGGTIYEIPEEDLVKAGVLTENKVVLFKIDHDIVPEEWSYSEVVKRLIWDCRERNVIINNLIKISKDLCLKTLVMFSSKYHGYYMERKSGVYFLSGDNNSEQRMEVKGDFLSKKGGILLVSEIWKKGITLPQVEILINADGGSEATTVIQKRGRTLGAIEGKTRSLTMDFIDNSASYLAEHSLNRILAYEKKVGKSNIVVFDTEDMEFWPKVLKFIKEWFNR